MVEVMCPEPERNAHLTQPRFRNVMVRGWVVSCRDIASVAAARRGAGTTGGGVAERGGGVEGVGRS